MYPRQVLDKGTPVYPSAAAQAADIVDALAASTEAHRWFAAVLVANGWAVTPPPNERNS